MVKSKYNSIYKSLNLVEKLKVKLFAKPFELNFKAISKEYSEEKQGYNKLKEEFKDKKLKKNTLTIYNPGGGSDITTILIMLDAIAKKDVNIKVVFQEIRDKYEGIVRELERFTKSPVIVEKHNLNIKTGNYEQYNYRVTAYYKNKKIEIFYFVLPVEEGLPNILRSGYDIYYERAFQFFRSNHGEFMYNASKFLKPSGLMMTDYGFDFNKFQKKEFVKLKNIPKNYGLYEKFQIWQKIKKE